MQPVYYGNEGLKLTTNSRATF